MLISVERRTAFSRFGLPADVPTDPAKAGSSDATRRGCDEGRSCGGSRTRVRSYHTLGREPGFFRTSSRYFAPGEAWNSRSPSIQKHEAFPRWTQIQSALFPTNKSSPAPHPEEPKQRHGGKHTSDLNPEHEAGYFGMDGIGVACV